MLLCLLKHKLEYFREQLKSAGRPHEARGPRVGQHWARPKQITKSNYLLN